MTVSTHQIPSPARHGTSQELVIAGIVNDYLCDVPDLDGLRKRQQLMLNERGRGTVYRGDTLQFNPFIRTRHEISSRKPQVRDIIRLGEGQGISESRWGRSGSVC